MGRDVSITLSVSLHGKELSRATFDGERPVRIGRAPTNDLVIDNPVISRAHAIVARSGSAWTISDLGTANGMYANGVRVDIDRGLNDGDRIAIGKFTIQVEIARDAVAPRVAAA